MGVSGLQDGFELVLQTTDGKSRYIDSDSNNFIDPKEGDSFAAYPVHTAPEESEMSCSYQGL